MSDYKSLPDDLPAPVDDGAADHLPGRELPDLRLQATDGETVALADLGPGRTIIYIYPMTGTPGVALPDGWDQIPGARGCTPQACAMRDHFRELTAAGAERIYGLSSQSLKSQRATVERLHLPYPLLADPGFSLADALSLPTFSAPGHNRLYSRLTLVAEAGRIEKAFYPIFPPDRHADELLTWLHENL